MTAIEIGIAAALLDSLWQTTLVVASAWLVLDLLASRSAALRHAVGMLFLLVSAVSPIATVVRAVLAPQPPVSSALPDVAALVPPAWLASLWAAGIGCKLVRFAIEWSALRRLENLTHASLPCEWQRRVERLRGRFGIVRKVDVRLVADVLPCTARLLRPIVFLPPSLLTRMSTDQLEAILAHELGHIRRLDWLWNGLQSVIDTLFFYHPAIWWLSRRIRQERENACDDLAAHACGDPIVLAEALGTLEAMRTPAFVLSSQGGLLMNRIYRLLTPKGKPPRRSILSLAALTLVGVAGALALQSGTAAAQDDAPRWWQLRGDAVQLSGTVDGERRTYIKWRGRDGEFRELYTRNGVKTPIDSAARSWITAKSEIPPPPPIPGLPAMAAMIEDPAYKSAVAELRRDPIIRAAVGDRQAVRLEGPSRITETRSELVLIVHGEKGDRRLRAFRETASSGWRFEPLVPNRG